MKYFATLFLILFQLSNFQFSLQAQRLANKIPHPKPSWNLVKSPSTEWFYYIKMFSKNSGFTIGKNFFEYDGVKWKKSQIAQTLEGINQAVFFSKSSVWCTTKNNTYQSELFYYNGKSWRKKEHPFSNTITIFNINEKGVGWYGGFRELAYNDGKRWKFIEYPNNYSAVKSIYGDNNNVWINTIDKKLFFYDGIKWKQFLSNERVNFIQFKNISDGFVLTDTKLYRFLNSKWTIHSTSELLDAIGKLSFLPNKEIWGIGIAGKVVLYKNGNWFKIPTPTNENLLDIQMLSEKDGWIVGVNGTLLHYSLNQIPFEPMIKFPLVLFRLMAIESEINDEYSVAIDDIDNDGLKDIYTVCLYKPNRLFINNTKYDEANRAHNYSFEEEATNRDATGITGESNSISVNKTQLGVGLADINNDGSMDLYITNLAGNNSLFINNGSGYFRNVSDQKNRATLNYNRTNAAIFGDVDNDGDLDLFITNEEGSNRLFLNNGNGYFTDITESSGLISDGGGMCAAFGDIDGDGKIDLCVTNWAKQNRLYKNVSNSKDGVKFIDITEEAGIGGEVYTKSNAVVFADYDNDGNLDLFIANRKSPNKLYHNNGKGIFEDVSERVIGKDTMLSYGACFADLDQDGYVDLFVSNVGENVLYKNIKGEKFVKVDFPKSVPVVAVSEYNTGAACGDIDNDGDVDFYVCNFINGESKLYINNLNKKNYITLDIKGSISNRDAIGAKVWLYQAGHAEARDYLCGYREVNSGSGYGSHNSKEVHFGTGDYKILDIVVLYPCSGIKKILKNIPAGTHLNLNEESTFAEIFTLSQKGILQWLTDPEKNIELVKIVAVIVLIYFSINRGKRKYKWNLNKQAIFHSVILLVYLILVNFFMHKNLFLSAGLPFSSVVINILLLHLVYERVIMARLVKEERRDARDRIARDLHDDLASTISSSAIYTEALSRTLANASTNGKELVERISNLLKDAANSIADIIWTASPVHDTLEDLILRLKSLIIDLCKANQISFSFDTIGEMNKIPLDEIERRNIYLISKEAINNIIKHSKATAVEFHASLTEHELRIKLMDDGIGFVIPKIFNDSKTVDKISLGNLHGNGLRNMYMRAKEIGANLLIESDPDAGTKITLIIKMT